LQSGWPNSPLSSIWRSKYLFMIVSLWLLGKLEFGCFTELELILWWRCVNAPNCLIHMYVDWPKFLSKISTHHLYLPSSFQQSFRKITNFAVFFNVICFKKSKCLQDSTLFQDSTFSISRKSCESLAWLMEVTGFF